MNRLAILTASLVCTCTSVLLAAEPAAEREERGEGIVIIGEGGAGGWIGGPGGGFVINGGQARDASSYISSLEGVNLTEEQKKTITAIIDARKKAADDFSAQNADKLKAASKAMTDAFKSGDQEAINKASQDYQALNAPLNKIYQKASADLNKVLTPAQTATLQDSRATALINNLTAPAKLTNDQLKQLKAAYKEGATDANPWGGNQKLMAAVDEVLTPDQKAAITRQRLGNYAKSMTANAKLTAEQQKQLDLACEELSKDGAAGLEAYQAVNDKVNAILTPEQKEARKAALGAWQAGGERKQANPGARQPAN